MPTNPAPASWLNSQRRRVTALMPIACLLVCHLSPAFSQGTTNTNVTAPTNMVLIPQGTFQMGAGTNEFPDSQNSAHPVPLDGYYIDKYEVTKALWDKVANWAQTNGYDLLDTNGPVDYYSLRRARGKGSDYPVTFVSWYDSVKWCNARSEMDGRVPVYRVGTNVYRTGATRMDYPQAVAVECNFGADGYRLPTSSEWEKAARGGIANTRFPWGNTIDQSLANYRADPWRIYPNNFQPDGSPTTIGIPWDITPYAPWPSEPENYYEVNLYGLHPSYYDDSDPNDPYIEAPVGSFFPNGYGLFDVIGNVAEWCWDTNPSQSTTKLVRGGSAASPPNNGLFLSRYGDSAPGRLEQTIGFRTVVTATPRPPVVFIHGIAGSVLKSGNRQIWPTITPSNVADLNVATGPSDTEAVDVLRSYLGSEIYSPFLQDMAQNHAYREFQMQEDRRRMTNSYMSTLTGANKPDLFVFPYDWRKPNATHTATLHAYLQNISNLHGGAKVNLVVHSMGGLVMRRYLLDYGSALVGRVVTVGSPLWGAPESAYRMFSGIFFGINAVDFINSSVMKTSVLSMPAVHELNPSTKFYQNWGLPVFVEEGLDYDGNGIKNEGYAFAKFRSTLDDLAYPQTPGTNNVSFHDAPSGRQDDWSTDTDGVEFLHIVGKQAVNQTTVGIRTRPKTLLESISPTTGSFLPPIVSGYGVFERIPGEGDGTVPTLSAKRMPGYYAPKTQVREITEPLADKPSSKQPKGQATEHTMLMENTTVWSMINSFFETGTAPPFPAPASRQAKTVRVAKSLGAPVLRITEIMSTLNSGNGSTPYTPDWIEVTNYGPSEASFTGYRIHDPSSGFRLFLTGVDTIAPGESVVFVKTNAPGTDVPLFRTIWGLSDSIKIGSYLGSTAVVMAANQDSVILYDPSDVEVTRVSYHAGAKNRSFNFFYNSSGAKIATASLTSSVGAFGAYNSMGTPPDVASPGASLPQTPRTVAIETVPVGDPGNAADTNSFGSVDYEYRIGKFEVTIGQYAAFLNSVATSDPYGLYNTNMASDLEVAGITRSGISGSFAYTTTGPSGSKPTGASSPENRPIVYVSWFDMARFCNWLHNGATNGADTETGAYTLNGATNGAAAARNADAKWRIPTENEWYKAAYYKGGGTNAGYWAYATGSTNAPNNNINSRTTGNQANIFRSSRFAVTQSTSYSTTQNYLTEAGAFNTSASSYGTFDQAGNVFELNDLTGLAGTNRGTRGGGCYSSEVNAISSWRRGDISPTAQFYDGGFRVATSAWPAPALNGLTFSSGVLTPAFSPETRSYTAHVPNSVALATLTAATADAESTITVNGSAVASGSASPGLDLKVGSNTFNVVVTAGDGITTRAYTVLVTRAPSSDASLTSLVLSSGTLNPAFTAETTAYTASVAYTTDSLTVTPTTSEAAASVKVEDTQAASGSPSSAISLGIGVNTIDILVTAPDGTTTKTYTVAVTRAEPTGRKQILVTGCGYVSIRDNESGDDNTLLSEISAKRIPGVEVVYNEEAVWVLIDFAADRHMTIGSVAGKPAAEVEVMTLTTTGAVQDVQRYRNISGPLPWEVTLTPNQSPSLTIDSNNDGTFAPGEQVAPDFSGSGPSIDMTPPDVELALSVVDGQIRLTAAGTDTSACSIRYQIDGEPASTYTGPISFPRQAQSRIALYAEDAMGNTSGVISTRLNPKLSLQAGPAASFVLEWPAADGYRLETAANLQGPWTEVAAPQLLLDDRLSTTVIPGTSKAFYRLVAHPVSK